MFITNSSCSFDFYLIPQTVREGTVTPTGFNIIHDTMGLPPDRIQQLTFRFCYFYVSILFKIRKNSLETYDFNIIRFCDFSLLSNVFSSHNNLLICFIHHSSIGVEQFVCQHHVNMHTNWHSWPVNRCKLVHQASRQKSSHRRSTSFSVFVASLAFYGLTSQRIAIKDRTEGHF